MKAATCCERVYSHGSFSGYRCGNKAKVERDGKPFCGIHDPVRVAERRATQNEKWYAEAAERSARFKKERAEAAEQKRRADCYTELLEALQGLVLAFENIGGEHVTGREGSEERLAAAYAAIEAATGKPA